MKRASLPILPLVSVILLCVLASTACGQATTPSLVPTIGAGATPTAAAQDQVTVFWSFWGDPWEVEVNRRIITVFQADHPNIKVEILHEPWDTYFDKAEEWLKSNRPPDVMFMEYVPIYAARGDIASLEPFMQRESYDLSDFYPDLLKDFLYQGSLYGLPRDSDTKVIFYNKEIFDRGGIPYPQQGWTWDDLRQTALALTRIEGGEVTQYGFAHEPDEWWRLWVWQNGGEVYDDDFAPTKTLIDSREAIDAIQWLADLTNVDGVTPPYEVQRTSYNIGRLFQEGKLAMAFGNHALIPGFAATPGLRWDVVGLPQQTRRVNVAAGAGFVITTQSKEKEAAWTFLKWLQSSKGQAIITETGIVVPARRSVGQADVFLKQNSPHNPQVFLQETELGRPNPMFQGVQEVSSLFNDAFAPLWRGEKKAGEVIEELVPQVNSLLDGT